jgi:uncharacterized protein YndB with AHSA1/START domain
VDITWKGSVTVDAPVERVYAYLADFPRHIEWAQTLETLELVRTGDPSGVGARYRTIERQAMQHDRKPHEPLTKGMRVVTICEVRELTPNRHIAWHAHTDPKAMGLYADLSFELAPAPGGGTLLTQHYRFHQPGPVAFIFKLIYGRDLDRKGYAQWDAGLRNIKTILEERTAAPAAQEVKRGGAYVA